MIAVALAVLAAASNALASVLQRRAARTAPAGQAFRLGLIAYLMHRPAWLGGIAALIGGFAFQAAALMFGGLSLVQPILVVELPLTMVFIGRVFRVRLDRRSWLAVGVLTAGLAMLLLGARPSEGHQIPGRAMWAVATLVTLGLVALLLTAARLATGAGRAAILGVAAGLGFSFTAALMKQAVRDVEHPATLLTTWTVYAMILAGLVSLFLLQNAFQSGSLVAVQPALTVADPVASIGYGVGLFGETIRLGAWSVLEIFAIGLIVYGSTLLAQSPPFRRHKVMAAGT
ncbi:DMT family transporter [Actinoallomurus sp. NBC_01490]|jgi:drug/metabolite transporter (DMT)-like permease|uniref:DMT family transporter n=1 Tax=Actinoallomurus sp. NBC_01490 TaxID=2903557 RepID=UPI002E363B52|nr:DMT family transporter [Actinoallomurus sp. NBC_01490]